MAILVGIIEVTLLSSEIVLLEEQEVPPSKILFRDLNLLLGIHSNLILKIVSKDSQLSAG